MMNSYGRHSLLILRRLASARHAEGARYMSTARNTVINFVPQQEAWVVERMGRFHKILEPGVNVLIPVLDKVKYVQSLKEIAIEIPQQGAITLDNVQLQLDGVLYLRVVDAYKASYGVDDPEFAVTQLAQTTMRSEVGKISLDTVFKERESLNSAIVEALNFAAKDWGITIKRYEIRTMTMPERIQQAMQFQVEAERRKRAEILESEGKRDAAINLATGEKKARILAAEAYLQERVQQAKAIEVEAEARKRGLALVSESLTQNGGQQAASLAIAEQYVKSFGNLAKTSNTLILPANASDATSMVAQAMSIYQKLSAQPVASSVSADQKGSKKGE
ncbi:Stomatin-like protein 2, mitochondrial [Aphelenchoides bicaudatus]|nr:Stomatin-like protein 2, mitochondrial [Aphelenchoides bicaudatus]